MLLCLVALLIIVIGAVTWFVVRRLALVMMVVCRTMRLWACRLLRLRMRVAVSRLLCILIRVILLVRRGRLRSCSVVRLRFVVVLFVSRLRLVMSGRGRLLMVCLSLIV